MKTILQIILAATFAISAKAADPTKIDKEAWKKMSPSERKAEIEYRIGGRLLRPGSGVGELVFVNAQKRINKSVLTEVMTNLVAKYKFNIALQEGEFSFPSPKLVGNLTLFIVDDPMLPHLLSAPENRWAMVNVARLSEGAGGKIPFLEARTKKEITRGFALLAGAQDSTYPNSLLGPVVSPADLDSHVDCRMPVDIIRRFKPYLEKFGVKPRVMIPYCEACKEGWAPAPTNEVQKAHWEAARKLPTKPIKVEYDPKKGE